MNINSEILAQIAIQSFESAIEDCIEYVDKDFAIEQVTIHVKSVIGRYTEAQFKYKYDGFVMDEAIEYINGVIYG